MSSRCATRLLRLASPNHARASPWPGHLGGRHREAHMAKASRVKGSTSYAAPWRSSSSSSAAAAAVVHSSTAPARRSASSEAAAAMYDRHELDSSTHIHTSSIRTSTTGSTMSPTSGATEPAPAAATTIGDVSPPSASLAKSFHRRELNAPAIAFSAPEGRRFFSNAVAAGR
jgi:hypothetical protein